MTGHTAEDKDLFCFLGSKPELRPKVTSHRLPCKIYDVFILGHSLTPYDNFGNDLFSVIAHKNQTILRVPWSFSGLSIQLLISAHDPGVLGLSAVTGTMLGSISDSVLSRVCLRILSPSRSALPLAHTFSLSNQPNNLSIFKKKKSN